MTAFAPFSEYQFQWLAMGKARGYTWNMMADQLSLPLEIIERLPWTHGKLWDRALAKAERLVARETIAEAVSTLRHDLRETEAPCHATIANSMARLLQLQQDFAPPRRRVPNVPPTPTPTPVAPCPTPSTPTPVPAAAKSPHGPLPSLKEAASAVLGLFFLVCALFVGCWNSQRPALSEDVPCEPVARLATPGTATLDAPAMRPSTGVVQTPPPWVREHVSGRHDT